LRKRLLSKRSSLVQSTERETKNGGTKRHKKMTIGRKMGGDGQECIGKTLAARGLKELRVNLLLKENSFVSNIILHRSLILELKFYKLYVLICIMFSSLVKRAFIYNLFYKLILF
jgi:hypothetical protein